MTYIYKLSSGTNARIAGISLALSTLFAGPADAQQAPPDSGLTDIIVTAEKREENLQSVPISVTAMTGESLTATGISNVEDLQFFAPGVSITNDAMAIINIRGIGTTAFGIATDPSTTVHYDGVYIPRPTTSYQDLFDVERIEILRGPQGVLFGRNSAAGTLNIISKMPTEALSGAIGLTLGNYAKRALSGTIAGPVGDRIGMSVTVLANSRDGIYRDVARNRRYQDQGNLAGRVTLAFNPTDDLEIVLRADASQDRETGSTSKLTSYASGGLAAAGATVPLGAFDIALDADPRYDVDAWGVSSTITWNNGPVTLKSITALRKSNVSEAFDTDATDLFLRHQEYFERSRSITQELQLVSNGEGALQWILGAFYLNEKGNDELRIIQPNRRRVTPETNATNAVAVFGQANYAVTDRLRLIGGLRYSWEEKDFSYRILVNNAQIGGGQPKDSWEAWTPKFGIDYDITKDIMLYAAATRGFKSGGFQLGDGQPFLPEYIWSYEAGVKSTVLDKRLRANFSAFYYNFTNLQVVEYINGVATTTNAGKARIKGFEAEILARPAPRLTLNSTLAWLDARYDVYFSQGADLSGNRLPNAPKWNVTYGAEYKAPLGEVGSLTLRADFSWRDRVYFKANNNPAFEGETVTLLNARAAWRPIDERWEIALYGRNLTNERYPTYKTAGVGATGVTNQTVIKTLYGEPRQYGVQLRHFF